jgi:hypothetical protein
MGIAKTELHNPDSTTDKTPASTSRFTPVMFQQADEAKTDALIAPGQIIISARVTIEFEMMK